MKINKNIRLSENALEVLKRRYLLKDKQGRVIEKPIELFTRVAKAIAEADRNYGADDAQVDTTAQSFFDIMASLEFLPNSPTLMNAGKELGQLSACFVLPVGDSMEEIFETNKNAAIIHKSGGGTGFSFSRLRPSGSIVASTSGVASGPVSFMKVFNASTEAVKQGGTRRGANMGILRVDHPDILEFISCKDNPNEIVNFNISVAATDSFMQAVADKKKYPLNDPHTGKVYIRDGREIELDASEVFDQIVDHAWLSGEPGIVFIDRMNQKNPTYPYETIESTNPCGEQPLPPYDSCNLGSVNLGKFVLEKLPDDYSISQADEGIDWDRLGKVVRTGVHFLDNVIDCNKYPLKEIEIQTKLNRRIGLGVMGWADMLVKLNLPYNSEQAIALAEQVMSFIALESAKHSSELAKTRGKFGNWENSTYKGDNVAMRNATLTTIAPTGTISIIAGCSSGIEPFYSIIFERNVLDGTKLLDINPLFERAVREEGVYSEKLIDEVASLRSLSGIANLSDGIRAIFLTAADITPAEHIKMQAVFQKQSDSSVSKTINFVESASREDVRQAFLLAYELDCKGVTIYRDFSRPRQVLSTTKKVQPKIETKREVKHRPKSLEGFTEKVTTGYGNLYVTVNVLDGRPFEVFAHIGHSGYTTMADTEAIARLISLSLRSGITVEEIIRQLRGIGGSSQTFSGGARIYSIPDAIAQVLQRNFASDSPERETSGKAEICPDCGQSMPFESGCFSCRSCGYSTC